MTNRSEAPRVVVIGGGQAGLAVGYYLRRSGIPFEILDAEQGPGGAWRHAWSSLRLFSPAQWSSLPGRIMSGGTDSYPALDELLEYLAQYEAGYELPVRRPVTVRSVHRAEGGLRLRTDSGDRLAEAVVSATGTWRNPYVPPYPGRAGFQGDQLHSARYRDPSPFAGKRVMVVGGGNSGAQILADVSTVAETIWVTLQPPRFLPDEVDGRYLFDQATASYLARKQGREPPPPAGFGDIVMVPPVRAARERGVLRALSPFEKLTARTAQWADGREEVVDAILWCTGFRPALEHLDPLRVVGPDGRVEVRGIRSLVEPRLWLVGYGEWTGFASATLIAVGRSARATVQQITEMLRGVGEPRADPGI